MKYIFRSSSNDNWKAIILAAAIAIAAAIGSGISHCQGSVV